MRAVARPPRTFSPPAAGTDGTIALFARGEIVRFLIQWREAIGPGLDTLSTSGQFDL